MLEFPDGVLHQDQEEESQTFQRKCGTNKFGPIIFPPLYSSIIYRQSILNFIYFSLDSCNQFLTINLTKLDFTERFCFAQTLQAFIRN